MPRFLKSRTFQILAGLVVVLIAVRLALPHVVKRYVNNKIDELDGYSGEVQEVRLRLLQGAYQIRGVRIVESGQRSFAPLFTADAVDLSIEWGALLDGSLVAEIELHQPVLNFVERGQEEGAEPARNWQEVVGDLAAFQINRFVIHDGEVHYRDFTTDPQIDIYVQDLSAVVRNLTNSEDLGDTLFASFEGEALAMGSGRVEFEGRVNPYAELPTFELNVQMNKLDMRQLNDFLMAYAGFDAEKGTFSIDAELAASNGRLRGYTKPFIEDLEVLDWQDEERGFFGKLWDATVEFVGTILEDSDKDRIATRVPIEGTLDDPDVGLWPTIGGLLKNAFIESLRRGLEGSIDLKQGAGGKEDE